MGRQEGGDADHGEAAVLELLHLHLPALVLVGGVALEVVDDGLPLAGVGLALQGLLVLVGLEGAAQDDELGPPLRVGLEDGGHGIGRRDVLRVEGAEGVGEEPADGGEHGRAAVGQLGLAGPLGRDPLGQVERVEELAAGLEVDADEVVVPLGDGRVEGGGGRHGGLRGKGGGRAGQGESTGDGALHLANTKAGLAGVEWTGERYRDDDVPFTRSDLAAIFGLRRFKSPSRASRVEDFFLPS